MGGQVCDGWTVDGHVYMDGLCMDVWVEALVYRQKHVIRWMDGCMWMGDRWVLCGQMHYV